MPSYNNAARNFSSYPDFDEELEQAPPVRRAPVNVPPSYRVAGSGGALTRQQAALPQPLPAGAPRRQAIMPNVPGSMPRPYAGEMTRRMPVAQSAAGIRRPVQRENPLSHLN